jgi:hypothetical protein
MTPESRSSTLLCNGGKQFPAEKNTHAAIKEPVSKQRIGKHTTVGYYWKRCFLFGQCSVVIKKSSVEKSLLLQPYFPGMKIMPLEVPPLLYLIFYHK